MAQKQNSFIKEIHHILRLGGVQLMKAIQPNAMIQAFVWNQIHPEMMVRLQTYRHRLTFIVNSEVFEVHTFFKFFNFATCYRYFWYLAWHFTILQNDNITISWDFFQAVSTEVSRHGCWCCQPKKISWYRNIIIL